MILNIYDLTSLLQIIKNAKTMCVYSWRLTGSDFFGCLGSFGVVLDDVNRYFILLSWSQA